MFFPPKNEGPACEISLVRDRLIGSPDGGCRNLQNHAVFYVTCWLKNTSSFSRLCETRPLRSEKKRVLRLYAKGLSPGHLFSPALDTSLTLWFGLAIVGKIVEHRIPSILSGSQKE